MKFTRFSIVLIFSAFVPVLKAQQVVASAGGESKAGAVYVSWTVGEVVTETFSSTGKSATQGMHQSDILITALKNPNSEQIVKIFPNPTSDALNIDLKNSNFMDYRVQTTALDGKSLDMRKFTTNKIILNLKEYPVGVYIVSIIDKSGKKIGVYKIVKTKD